MLNTKTISATKTATITTAHQAPTTFPTFLTLSSATPKLTTLVKESTVIPTVRETPISLTTATSSIAPLPQTMSPN